MLLKDMCLFVIVSSFNWFCVNTMSPFQALYKSIYHTKLKPVASVCLSSITLYNSWQNLQCVLIVKGVVIWELFFLR